MPKKLKTSETLVNVNKSNCIKSKNTTSNTAVIFFHVAPCRFPLVTFKLAPNKHKVITTMILTSVTVASKSTYIVSSLVSNALIKIRRSGIPNFRISLIFYSSIRTTDSMTSPFFILFTAVKFSNICPNTVCTPSRCGCAS